MSRFRSLASLAAIVVAVGSIRVAGAEDVDWQRDVASGKILEAVRSRAKHNASDAEQLAKKTVDLLESELAKAQDQQDQALLKNGVQVLAEMRGCELAAKWLARHLELRVLSTKGPPLLYEDSPSAMALLGCGAMGRKCLLEALAERVLGEEDVRVVAFLFLHFEVSDDERETMEVNMAVAKLRIDGRLAELRRREERFDDASGNRARQITNLERVRRAMDR